jgi:hypothetical protein
MQKKYGVYLSDSTVVFFEVDNLGVELLFEEYVSSPDLEEKCNSLFNKYKNTEVAVFLDLIGEEYKHESMPHVSGKDRELLLARKQQSLFPGSDLVWKTHVEREKTGRKDDVYLMMGIQLPKMVKDTFSSLIENELTVSGVYSMSILENALQKAIPKSEQHLMISRVLGRQQSHRSYRQTFSKNQEIVISRVTRAKGESVDESLSSLMVEIERMHHFLNGAKHLRSDHTLNVIVACADKETRRLLSKNTDSNIELKYLDLYQLATKLGLERPTSVSSLPELLASLTLNKKIAPHFKPKELCAKYQQNVINNLLKKTAIAMVALSLLVSAGLWWNSQVLKNETNKINALKIDLSDQHNALGLELSGEGITPQLMENTVRLYGKISKNQYTPNSVFEVLAEAYTGFHDITLLEINWLAEKVDMEDEQESRVGTFLTALNEPRQFTVKLGLPKTMSDREVVERVNSFSTSLLNHVKITDVSQTSAAINIKSSGLMERTVGAESKDGKPIEFTLLVTMKL